ncbi:MAG: cell envelope integrity protein CreD [Rhodanobacter sp.]|nr:cell envelope integrity protein CreD [Rhodanobacter sp.]
MFSSARHPALMKVLMLLLLTVLLYIPLGIIQSLIDERGASQDAATQELAQTYTHAQMLVGPLLVVPYVESWKEARRDDKGNETGGQIDLSKDSVYLVFPDTLDLDGRMMPETRYRGIFSILFYKLEGTLRGRFAAFDADAIAHSQRNSSIELKTPYVAVGLSDLRGFEGSPVLSMAGEKLRFAQGVPGLSDKSALASGIHAPLTGAVLAQWRDAKAMDFELPLTVIGQGRLSVAPVAEETTAHIQSSWADPSFGGNFLAAQRTVSAQGFDAHWRISSLVTKARAQVRSLPTADDATYRPPGTSVESFDVSLVQPLNVYAMATRAAKYGVMFIALVLMAAFMFELFKTLRLHPVQYALVGLAIALFFLLLVALSEKIEFWQAYVVAAGASVALLAVYFSTVLHGWRRGLSLGGFVAVLYAALYGLLASEDNALLLGSLLVFGMLAALMLMTRKVDWYALK